MRGPGAGAVCWGGLLYMAVLSLNSSCNCNRIVPVPTLDSAAVGTPRDAVVVIFNSSQSTAVAVQSVLSSSV